ncbi:MAG: substrate-binding domain-containing protein [Nitrospirae bacterium]|nr:substrate-binding domain-containing protein [Nitrospirota bacterium]
MKNIIALAIISALLWTPEAFAEIYVVVNKKNPINKISTAQLAKIYKGTLLLWPDGKRIAPVEVSETLPLAEEFSEKILKMGLEMKQKMWVHIIYSGQGAPPVHVKDETDILSFVASEPGAIGYVRKGTVPEPFVDSVKVIPTGEN